MPILLVLMALLLFVTPAGAVSSMFDHVSVITDAQPVPEKGNIAFSPGGDHLYASHYGVYQLPRAK